MKKLRRIICVVLAFMFTLSITAFAENPENIEEVLLSVKERIGDTSEYKNFESHTSENQAGISYGFYWNGDSKNLSVTATQNGLIVDYYYSDGSNLYNEKPNLSQISIEEAEKRTKELISALNPKISDKIEIVSDGITQDLYRNGFSFNLKRYENGIEVRNNNGYVRVNGDATKILSFNLSFDENLQFPSPDNILSLGDAQKIYGEKIGMSLEYRANFDYKTKTRTVIPVYVPKESDKFINAITGEITEFVYSDLYFNEKMAADSTAGSGSNAALRQESLSEAEKTEFKNLEGLKTKDELIKIIKTNPYTNITDDMVLRWYNTSKSHYEDTYTASLSFEKNDGEYKYLNATVNMKTGEIISFNKGNKSEIKANSKELSENEINSKKEKVFKDLAKNKSTEYKYEKSIGNFIRFVNDIPFKQDSAYVDISKETGEVLNYRISYTDIEFPKIDNVIIEDKALQSLFNNVSYDVYYAKMESNAKNAELIYILDETMPSTIDAFSGKLLGYSNEEYINEKFTGYTDIENHYAKDAINTLAKFGIRFEGNEFKPNDFITEKEYIALLVSTFKNRNTILLKADEAYTNEYSTAYRENIILPEESNPNGILTRELSAKYMIRAMGLEKIASIPDIYISPFNDVLNYKGHIAILNGLKVIKGDGNGNFNPLNPLTRADAIMLIYNYLAG